MTEIFVSGMSGFIGKNLLASSIVQGISIKPLDLRAVQNDLPHDSHIIHLASLTNVQESWISPSHYYMTNIDLTVRALEIARKSRSSIIFISSYVYGTAKAKKIDEEQPLDAHSPYNHSKLVCEELCKKYAQFYGVDVTILRPFNLYGPNQRETFLIPTIISQCLDEECREVSLENVITKRDFLYVDDFINGVFGVLNLKGFNVFNLGSGESHSVGEIVEMIQSILGKNKPVIGRNVLRPNEILDLSCNFQKIHQLTGWKPKVSLSDGLRKTIEHRLNMNNQKRDEGNQSELAFFDN